MRRLRPRYPAAVRLLSGLAGWIAPWVLRGWFWTCRVTVLGRGVERDWLRSSRGSIGTCWHRNILTLIWRYRGIRCAALASWSKDGEMVSRVLQGLGYEPVRGSASKGGLLGLHDLAGFVSAGRTAALIADGPRGPAEVAKSGLVTVSRHTRRPVVPIGVHAPRALRFRSWDRMVLPLPFSRVVIAVGDPIQVPDRLVSGAAEDWRRKVEEGIRGAEREAEGWTSGNGRPAP